MKVFYKISIAIVLYALLAIPDHSSSIHLSENKNIEPSAKWWGKFAQNLVRYRITNKQNQQYQYNKHRALLINHLNELELELTEPDNKKLDSINSHINKLSALASLLPTTIHEFGNDVITWRKLLKYQSRFWDTSNELSSSRLTRFMVESRLAFESALIQSEVKSLNYNSSKKSINSYSKLVNGILFKSGDIIACNLKADINTNISIIKELPNAHNRLGSVYINDEMAVVIFMDAEEGLSTKSLSEFLNIAPNGILLRLREDLPYILRNPLAPALAASSLYEMALNGAYKYDFKFDLETNSYLYDWELIKIGLKSQGLTINFAKNNRSSSSIYFGNRKAYITPSEIELDNRFLLKGQWNNSHRLYENRLLVASTDALIRNQNSNFLNPFLLPIYRLLKGYSIIIEQVGLTGPVPAGVTAQTQLVFNTFKKRQIEITNQLKKELFSYEEARNHKAIYLKIIQKANEIVTEQ